VLQEYLISAIYSSPARRAYKTILPLAERKDIPIKTETDYLPDREMGKGDAVVASRLTHKFMNN